jgi:hypothetical protein
MALAYGGRQSTILQRSTTAFCEWPRRRSDSCGFAQKVGLATDLLLFNSLNLTFLIPILSFWAKPIRAEQNFHGPMRDWPAFTPTAPVAIPLFKIVVRFLQGTS